MNKSKFVTGVILLAAAGLLTALYFILPPDNLMFMIGDENLPYIPAIVMGVIGIVMLAGSGKNEVEKEKREIVVDPEKASLNKRLETIAWGLFLIMLGGFAFFPRDSIPGGAWSVGIGLIMLGLNLARYLKGIKMSGFTTVLGLLSIISGVLQLFGVHDIEGAVLLIILGAYIIIKPTIEKDELFGKAEEK